LKLDLKKEKGFKVEILMSIIRWRIVNRLREIFKNVNVTYGYLTKSARIKLGIVKSHVNDAFVIAGGENQIRFSMFGVIQKRRNNRCLQINRKGFKPSIKKQRYNIHPMDLIKVNGYIFVVRGMSSYGRYVQSRDKLNKIISIVTKNIDAWLFYQNNLVWHELF
jgi:hypothetical protein